MKNAPVRHRLEYALFLAARGAIRSLPHEAVRGLGRALGKVAYGIDGRRRRIGRENLGAAFPELPEAERERLLRRCFAHFGAAFLDVLSAARFDLVGFCRRLSLEGWHHLVDADAGGRGVLLMGAHVGTWEILPWAISAYRGPLTLVGRRADNPFFADEVDRLRGRFGARTIDKRGSVRDMLRTLAEKGRLGTFIDQRVRADEAIDVPFFGRPALTSPIVARLAEKTGALIVPAFGFFAPNGGYRIEILPPLTADAASSDGGFALTRRAIEVVEGVVRREPEQWLWLHRRWKH